jgi:hypothetical protein
VWTFRSCTRCGNCTDKHRWDQPQRFVSQWARVRECYRMVQSHERAHRHRFDGIFRLRPDMLFVTAVDLSWVQLALGKDTGMKEVRQKELAVRTLTCVPCLAWRNAPLLIDCLRVRPAWRPVGCVAFECKAVHKCRRVLSGLRSGSLAVALSHTAAETRNLTE